MNKNKNYKDSGIKWIGEIPKHWEISKIKYIHRQEHNSFIDGDWIESPFITDQGIRYITTGNIGEGFFKFQGNSFISEETFEELGCTEVFPGDLVISRLSPPVGRSCIIPNLGYRIVTSVDNVIIRLKNHLIIEYYNYLFNSKHSYDNTSTLSRGATLTRISRSMLGNIETLVPPLEEQKIISRYLDKRTEWIDSLIKKIHKKIELLKEQRTSLINQCVTKGLTPNIEMKDSGVEWISEIPKHWKMSKIKYNSSVGTGSTPKSEIMSYWNGEIRWYTPTDFKSVDKKRFLRSPSQFITQKGLSNSSCSFIDKDAVLLTTRAPVGNVGKIKKNFTFNQGCKSLIPRANLDISYLYFYLKTVTEPLNVIANGTTFTELSIQNLLNFEIPIPPLEEQKIISHYLNKKTEQIDSLIEKNQKKIGLLKEYRQSLISSVVIGKVKITEGMV